MWVTIEAAEVIVACVMLLAILVLYRRYIYTVFDPFVLNAALVISSLALIFTKSSGVNGFDTRILAISFLVALVCARLFLYFLPNYPKFSGRKEIALKENEQFLISLFVLLGYLCVLLFNYILGFSPLLSSGGYLARFETSSNNRILEYFNVGMAGIPFVFLLSSCRRARFLSVLSIVVLFAINLLQANKIALMYPALAIANTIFLKKLFFNEESKNLKRLVYGVVCVVIMVLPFYVSAIGGIDPEIVFQLMASRLFLTMDSFILAHQVNFILYTDAVSFWQLYFQPFLKMLGLYSSGYNSAADYVIYRETGLFPGEYNGPMDNLFIELLVTQRSLCISVLVLIAVVFVVVLIRRRIAVKRQYGIFDVILLAHFGVTPFMYLTHGYLFFISFLLSCIFVCVFYVLSKIVLFFGNEIR